MFEFQQMIFHSIADLIDYKNALIDELFWTDHRQKVESEITDIEVFLDERFREQIDESGIDPEIF